MRRKIKYVESINMITGSNVIQFTRYKFICLYEFVDAIVYRKLTYILRYIIL